MTNLVVDDGAVVGVRGSTSPKPVRSRPKSVDHRRGRLRDEPRDGRRAHARTRAEAQDQAPRHGRALHPRQPQRRRPRHPARASRRAASPRTWTSCSSPPPPTRRRSCSPGSSSTRTASGSSPRTPTTRAPRRSCSNNPISAAYLIVDEAHMQMPEMPLIKFIDGWETVAEMEAALGIPEGNLVATLDRYNENAAKGEDPDFHKQPEYVAAQDNGPWAAFDLSLGVAMYSGFTDGRAGGVDRRRGAARGRQRRSPGCTPRARARPTSPRTARATPAAPSWARGRSSAGAPASTPPSSLGRERRRAAIAIAVAEQLEPPVVVLLDGGAMADADHDAVGQLGCAALGTARTPDLRRAPMSTRRGTPPSAWPAAPARTRRAAARRARAPCAQSATSSSRLPRCPSVTVSSADADLRRRRIAVARRDRRPPRADRPAARRAAADRNMVPSSVGQRSVPEVNGHSCARLRSSVVLPRARAAGDHQRIAGVQPHVERVDQPCRPPVCGPRRRQLDASRHGSASTVNDGSALACFVGGDQTVEADDRRAVAGERVVDGAEERQRALHRPNALEDWVTSPRWIWPANSRGA